MAPFLSPPDPSWPAQAQAEITRWQDALGPVLIACHHIGSTSVPQMPAKPVIDLLPVVTSLAALERATDRLTTLGYEPLGAFGLPGRRYFRKDAPNGTRLVQAHAYATGDPSIARHLAFRDLLRADPASHAAYAAVKRHADEHCDGDINRYMDLKDPFIQKTERRALTSDPTSPG